MSRQGVGASADRPLIRASWPTASVGPVTVPTNLGYVGLALLVGGESLGLILPGETAILAA